MDSNTHSAQPPAEGPPSPPDVQADARPNGRAGQAGLATLAAAVEELAAQELGRLTDAALADQVLQLRRLLDRLEGHWLKELAAVDARGAAGADQGESAHSTAAWLRHRLRLGSGAARSAVRTARALFGGALPQTAQALVAGELSPAHAKVVADGTHQLPGHLKLAAEPVVLAAAGRLDPPLLGRLVGQLCQVADPDGADRQAERRHARRGVWLSSTWEGMVAVDGLLDPEAGATLVAALAPLTRPADAEDARSGGQRTADALTELARRALEGGRLPQTGGVRPQLLVTVDLDSLLAGSGAIGGELGGAGWVGPLASEGCRRLACDGALTRVLVTRQPSRQHQGCRCGHDPSDGYGPSVDPGLSEPASLQQRLRAAIALLPPALGGAPTQPLELGRSTRVVHPAQRAALAVRDGGCVFPGCDRPLGWCEAHHLQHWLDGGPSDLANLTLVCRAHHRRVHEEGWQLTRGPDGNFTATPTHRPHHAVT